MSPRSRGMPTILLLFVVACASPGPGDTDTLAPAVTNPGYVSRYGTNVNAYVPADQGVVSAVMEGSASDAWKVLVDVLEEAGIPVTQRDPDAGTAANPDLKLRRRLMGQRLSRFLNCGEGFTGATANTARIEMNISAKVSPAEEGQVRIDVLVGAVAHPTEGTSTESAACNSSQRLEHQILNRVQERLSGSSR